MDWIHFWIIQIVFWVGFWLGPIQVEPRQFRPRLSKVDPSPRRTERPGPSRIESLWTKVKPSHFGPKSSRVISDQSRVESFRANVEQSRFGKKSSQAKSGQCRVVRAQVDVESPRPISSLASPNWCRDERTWTNVESTLIVNLFNNTLYNEKEWILLSYSRR